MNILFVDQVINGGGVAVVTKTLANCFVLHGHNVGICLLGARCDVVGEPLQKNIKVYMGHGFRDCVQNVSLLRSILVQDKVDVIVNQWGLPFFCCRMLGKARKGLPARLVSVYHSQPDRNGRNVGLLLSLSQGGGGWLRRLLLRVRLSATDWLLGRSMRYVYNHSDAYLVLSAAFVPVFQNYTGLRSTPRLRVQTNPACIPSEVTANYVYDASAKRKEIVYVGRLDESVKRVDRILSVWRLLESRLPEWSLTIVGDGPGRQSLQNMARDCGLRRVSFEGVQTPVPYYMRASLLMLTSEFEGFGMVITEGMSFGVVPVVYDSYLSLRDIVDDGRDGLIIPKVDGGFSATKASEMLLRLINNPDALHAMALRAIDKSRNFSLEKIYSQWMLTFDAVTANRPAED